MKKFAIIYGNLTSDVQRKAVELLSRFLLDEVFEYPECFAYSAAADYSAYRCIYIGTKQDNPYIAQHSEVILDKAEQYRILVKDEVAMIEGSDDRGVLYGCVDFYNKYIVYYEFIHEHKWCTNFLTQSFPDFEYTSAPAVSDRGIWTWGHVIYDYRGFIDNMVLLKMNTIIIWNDFVPVNVREMIEYAHSCGIKVIWGYAWLWGTKFDSITREVIDAASETILQKFEEEYADLLVDGIYFQSFTELKEEYIGDIFIPQVVTDFVNKTAGMFYEKYPDLELQFGLHATSVKDRLNFISKVNPKIRIVWEDCGAFPFAYDPRQVENFAETKAFVEETVKLRGAEERFGVVTKGFTTLCWPEFKHMNGSVYVGTSSEFMKHNRVLRKSKQWRYFQAYWMTNADKAYEMIQTMASGKEGDLYVTALVEDGMFEENIMYPVALYAEMLWDCNADLQEMMSEVALRSYVTFA